MVKLITEKIVRDIWAIVCGNFSFNIYYFDTSWNLITQRVCLPGVKSVHVCDRSKKINKKKYNLSWYNYLHWLSEGYWY